MDEGLANQSRSTYTRAWSAQTPIHIHLYTYTYTHTHTNTHTHTVYINYYYYNFKKKQNQTFAHTHIVSHFCHGFNSSLIQIHRDSLHFSIIFTIGSMMSHFFHDVPYIYWIRIWDIMLYFLPSCYIITEGYRYIYIYATPSTIRIKVL